MSLITFKAGKLRRVPGTKLLRADPEKGYARILCMIANKSQLYSHESGRLWINSFSMGKKE